MRYICSVLLFLVSTSLFAYNKFAYYQIQVDQDSGVPSLPNHLKVGRLKVDEIKAMVAGSGSYQDFLRNLKKASPGLFEQFILLHHSGSLQKASLTKPRTVLFNEGLILSFAEDQGRYQRTIEIIQLEPDYSFSFHEIVFDEGIHFTENPKTCKSCHGDRLRPLWEPYDFWPKIFGSHLSRFGSEEERSAYYSLTKTKDPSSVLSYLEFPKINGDYNHLVETFTQYVSMMSMMSMVHEWKEMDNFQGALFPIAAILSGCTTKGSMEQQISQLKGYIDARYWESLEQQLPEIYQVSLGVRSKFKAYLAHRYEHFFPNSKSLFDMNHNRLVWEVTPVAQLRFILERMGIFFQNYTQSQGVNPYFMAVPGNYQMDLLTAFMAIAPEQFMALKPSFSSHDFVWPQFNCQKLKDKAQEFESQLQLDTNVKGAPKKRALGACLSCHTFEKSAPYIPFDDTAALSTWLKQGGIEKLRYRLQHDGAGQMPPKEMSWSNYERSELLSLFEDHIMN